MANFTDSIIAYFGGDTTGLEKAATRAQGIVGNVATAVKGIALGIGAGAVIGWFKSVTDYASQVADLSDALDMTTDSFQTISTAIQNAGGDAQSAAQLLRTVRKSVDELADGNSKAIDSFEKLGLTQKDLIGIPLEQALEKIAKAYAANSDKAGAYAALTDIVGTKSTKLLGFLKELANDGYGELEKKQRAAGQVIDSDVTKRLDQLGDRFTQTKNAIINFSAVSLDAFVRFSKSFEFLADKTKQFVTGTEKAVQAPAAVAEKAVAALERVDARLLKSIEQAVEAEQKYAQERGTGEQQLNAMLSKNISLRMQMREHDANSVAYQELRKKLAESNLELEKKDLEIVKEIAETRLNDVTKWGALAVSYGEKRNALGAQEKELLAQIDASLEAGRSTKEAQAKLDAVRISQAQLEREAIEKMKGSMELRLEIARLEQKAKMGLTELEVECLRLAKLQLEEDKAKLKFRELLQAQLDGKLKPGEEELLETLRRQLITLGMQVDEVENIIAALKGGVKPAVDNVTEAVHDQGRAWDIINGKIKAAKGEAIVLQAIIQGIETSSNFGDETTSVLEEKVRRNKKEIAKLELGKRTGPLSLGANEVDDLEIARLKLTNLNLQNEINARYKTSKLIGDRGYDYALQNFKGTPESFQNFSDLAMDRRPDFEERMAQHIESIKNMLQNMFQK